MFPTDPETGRPKIIGLRKLKCINTDHLERTGYSVMYEEYLDEPLQALNLYTMGRVNVDQKDNLNIYLYSLNLYDLN